MNMLAYFLLVLNRVCVCVCASCSCYILPHLGVNATQSITKKILISLGAEN